MTYCCEECLDELLDLLYDELLDDRKRIVLAHLENCDSCREKYEQYQLTRKMTSTLSPVAFPKSLGASIIAAAGAQCDSVLESAPAVVLPDALENGNGGFLQSLRSLFLKPAFATAVIACAVLLVTVFFVGQMGPSVGTEGSVSALLERAPLGPVVEPPLASAKSEVVDSVPMVPSEEPVAEPAPMVSAQLSKATSPVLYEKNENEIDQTEKQMIASKSSGGGQVFDELKSKGARARRKASPSLSSPNKKEALHDAPAAAPAMAPSVPKSAMSFKSKKKTGDAFKRGMAAYRRKDCETAIHSFKEVVQNPSAFPGKRAPAMHHLARCEKRQGRCSQAMSWYDNLISDHPAYSGIPSALWEASQCSKRLGRTGRARELLEMLSTIPGWEEKARSQLEQN